MHLLPSYETLVVSTKCAPLPARSCLTGQLGSSLLCQTPALPSQLKSAYEGLLVNQRKGGICYAAKYVWLKRWMCSIRLIASTFAEANHTHQAGGYNARLVLQREKCLPQ